MFIPVPFHLCDHRGIDICDPGTSPLAGAACDRNLRQRAKLHTLCIRIASPDGLPRHHLHVFFLLLTIETGHHAMAGIILHEIHPARFLCRLAPDHALVFIAGNRHPDGRGIAFRDGLEGYFTVT